MTLPVGTILNNTYRVERLLGEGGMGAVYEVSHQRIRRRFALKVLRAEISRNAEAVARFRREAEVTSGLGHPGIVEVTDFDVSKDGQHYLVMELLEGESLEQAMERPMRLGVVVEILEQVASALQAAHEAGVVHRDLKPQNIMLARRGDQRQAKILDFGISKILGVQTDLTRTGVMLGTPFYMSPEQASEQSASADPRADIFSLGAIVYKMLVGRPPFAGTSLAAIVHKVVYEAPPDMRELRPDLPEAVVRAVERALSKNPAERQSSAVELARELAAGATDALDRAPPTVRGLPVTGPDLARLTTLRGATGEVELPPEPRRRSWVILLVSVALVSAAVGTLLLLRPWAGAPAPAGALAGPADSRSVPGASAPDLALPDRGAPGLSAANPDATAPAVVKPPTARAHRRTGILHITARDSGGSLTCKVWVDRVRIGFSPATTRRLPAGRHRVLVRCPGYKAKHARVTLRPGSIPHKEVIRLP